jgi:hypothetical protein
MGDFLLAYVKKAEASFTPAHVINPDFYNRSSKLDNKWKHISWVLNQFIFSEKAFGMNNI